MKTIHSLVLTAVLALPLFAGGCAQDSPLSDGMPDGARVGKDYHPSDWNNGSIHGAAAEADIASCQRCHGDDLNGGLSGKSCLRCHEHPSGYPTGKIHGPDARENLSACLACHGADQNGGVVGVSCVACHGHPEGYRKAEAHGTDAEEDLTACLSCHRFDEPGEIVTTSCFDCHDHPDGYGTGSAHGPDARADFASCLACHGSNLRGGEARQSCLGCHGHGEDYADPSEHGPDALADTSSCGVCHGSDFRGGPTGESCVACHTHSEGYRIGARHGTDAETDIESCVGCHGSDLKGGLTGGSCMGCHRHPEGYSNGETHGEDAEEDIARCKACHGADLKGGHSGASCAACHGHEEGYSARTEHGLDYLKDRSACSACHGEDLTGGTTGPSCQSCHSGWQSSCSFCHGGAPGNPTNAPPYDTRGSSDTSSRSVGAHSMHVTGQTTHEPFECSECHLVPASLESQGHLDPNGAENAGADVTFSSWLAQRGAAYSEGTCSNVYCHGKATSKSWTTITGSRTCSNCHGFTGNPSSLGGQHEAHVGEAGLHCADCHADTINREGSIKNRASHLNRTVDVSMPWGTYQSGTRTCSISCHGSARWDSDEDYHTSDTWTSGAEHGMAFLQGEGCTACHGEALDGGYSEVSCDECHTSGTAAWRTQCNFCHGSSSHPSGAPPLAVNGSSSPSVPGVGAHAAHTAETATHSAFSCGTCHHVYASFDDPGHIDTVGRAEVVFNSANPNGQYGAENAACVSLYCHGNGRSVSGPVVWTSTTDLTCTSCHGNGASGPNLSGRHGSHLEEGLTCHDCHGDTVGTGGAIAQKAKHVNGVADVKLPTGTYNGTAKTCSSVAGCHTDAVNWNEED